MTPDEMNDKISAILNAQRPGTGRGFPLVERLEGALTEVLLLLRDAARWEAKIESGMWTAKDCLKRVDHVRRAILMQLEGK